MNRLLLPVVIVLASLLAAWGNQPPEPRPATDTGFSAERAMTVVRRVAAKPHPVGSPANAEVRNYLVRELESMGLEVRIQRAVAVRQNERFGAIGIATVENIIARLPGRDASAPAVALMAHYDSAPYAPGAGDDAAGTASLVETARLMAKGPRPHRDVLFLLTDGEETGLLGAQAFFNDHPLAAHVGAVVNVEARGTAGRGAVFRTSSGNAALIGLWASSARNAVGSSAADAVARRLPNDTDLTVALEAGKIGIDAAMIGEQYDYHRPTDRWEHLDRGGLQQLGDYAYGMTRALAFADRLPLRGGDAAFFDVFGLFMVHYPIWLNWVLLGLAGAGVIAILIRAGLLEAKPLRILGGVVALPGITVLSGAATHYLQMLLSPAGARSYAELLAELPQWLWVHGAVILGLVLLAGFGAAGWIASMILVLGLGVAAQLLLPGAAYVFVWPLILGLAVAAVARRRGLHQAPTRVAAAVVGGLGLAFVFQLLGQLHEGVGALTPAALALSVPLGVLLVGPLLLPWSRDWRGRGLGALVLGVAGLGAGWIATNNGFNSRRPAVEDLYHLTDTRDGRAYWATSSGDAVLAGSKETRFSDTLTLWTRPASAVSVPAPSISAARGSGRPELTVAAPSGYSDFLLSLKPRSDLRGVLLNGQPIKLPKGQWTSIRPALSGPATLSLSADSRTGATLDVRYVLALPDPVPGSPQPLPAPTNWTRRSGSRAALGALAVKLK